MVFWLKQVWRRVFRALGLHMRYGIRYGTGSRERDGFATKRAAMDWAGDNLRGVAFVVYEYEPIDLWLPDAQAHDRRVRVTRDSSIPPSGPIESSIPPPYRNVLRAPSGRPPA